MSVHPKATDISAKEGDEGLHLFQRMHVRTPASIPSEDIGYLVISLSIILAGLAFVLSGTPGSIVSVDHSPAPEPIAMATGTVSTAAPTEPTMQTGVAKGPWPAVSVMLFSNGGNNTEDDPSGSLVDVGAETSLVDAATTVYRGWVASHGLRPLAPGERVRLHAGDSHVVDDSERGTLASGTFLYVVPDGDFFFWPGVFLGHVTTIAGVKNAVGEPQTVETVSLSPRAVVMENFITEEEMAFILDSVDEHFERSFVRSANDDGSDHDEAVEARTSEQTWLHIDNDLTRNLYYRIARATATDVDLATGMQVLSYREGQHYHGHWDYFDPKLYSKKIDFQHGRNRMITVFFYLSDVEEGGETHFLRAGPNGYGEEVITDYGDCTRGISVKPKRGTALVFYSLKADRHMQGNLDPMSLHSGCDVIKGRKLAANRWIWNKVYGAEVTAEERANLL